MDDLVNVPRMKSRLKVDEGDRQFVYNDTLGIPTIGSGRNLRDTGLSISERDMLLTNDIARTLAQIRQQLPWFDSLNSVRKEILINMGFMGVSKLMGFKKMLAAMKAGDWETAAAEGKDSLWAKQVGDRSERLMKEMVSGVPYNGR